MGELYVMLNHDLVGLGKKGRIVTKEAFDAFVREQIEGLELFLRPHQDGDGESQTKTPEAVQ